MTSGYAQYQPGDPIEIEKDVTLYALWVDKSTTPKTGDERQYCPLGCAGRSLRAWAWARLLLWAKSSREN